MDPNPRNNDAGYRFMARALSSLGEDTHAGIIQVPSVERALEVLADSEPESFHLVVSHWGHNQGPEGQANALHLL